MLGLLLIKIGCAVYDNNRTTLIRGLFDLNIHLIPFYVNIAYYSTYCYIIR